MKRFAFAAGVMALPIFARGADPSLLDAIRAGDAAAVRARLDAGADVNARDETGATALMYSAIYAPPETMRLLIEKGADANIPNLAGSTPLMWAAGDAAKVRLLLDGGAAIRAKTAAGVTPLLVAIRFGDIEAVRALLSAGGDAAALTSIQTRVLYQRDNGDDLRRVLGEAGARPAMPDDATAALVSGNAVVDQFATIGHLVDAGANPDTQVTVATITVPALALIAYGGSVGAVRAMLDRGVDPNRRSSSGATPLMLAAFSSRSSPELVRLLLARRADPAARDDAGRSALDWALTLGETPVAKALRDAGARASDPATAQAAAAHPRSARDAIAAALERLEPAGPGFFNHTKCISCHNQSLPAIAAARAAAHGVNAGAVAANAVGATLTAWRVNRENVLLGQQGNGGFVANVTYGLFSLAETGAPHSLVTDAMALRLAALQRADGTWTLDDLRPPLGDLSPVSSTALAIRGLDAFMPAGRRADLQPRLERALAFVRSVDPKSTQDEAFKLLALTWSRVAAPEIAMQRERLLALQRADGGWGQLPALAPDAYATGQALFALATAGVRAADEPYTRGAAYLLRTQLDDGTWLVRSRALGIQAYFESGFPHGRNQFISAAATSWAAIALSSTLPD